jgi:hypothetical protein
MYLHLRVFSIKNTHFEHGSSYFVSCGTKYSDYSISDSLELDLKTHLSLHTTCTHVTRWFNYLPDQNFDPIHINLTSINPGAGVSTEISLLNLFYDKANKHTTAMVLAPYNTIYARFRYQT